MRNWIITAALLLAGSSCFSQDRKDNFGEISWPDGKKAAVCLSYDDGMRSHLETAIPDLDEAGFPGTFYLMGSSLLPEFIPRWREAAAHGHELGCHSLFHPCSGQYDWVPEEYSTENYTLRRIFDELKVMNQFLYAVDGQKWRSYAYPCHIKEVGGINYVDSLSRMPLFVGARNGYADEPLGKENLNLFDIPSKSVTDDVDYEETVAYIDQACENGTLAVFCFHGVGSGYIVTSHEYHRKIIAYLKAREDEIWVASMKDILLHLQELKSD